MSLLRFCDAASNCRLDMLLSCESWASWELVPAALGSAAAATAVLLATADPSDAGVEGKMLSVMLGDEWSCAQKPDVINDAPGVLIFRR